jgi:hypothetical protein
MSDNHGILPHTVATLVEEGLIVSHDVHGAEVLRCPVCDTRITARSGWGPHKNGHLRAAGLLPPVVGKPRKPKVERKPRAAKPSPPPMSTRDACLGLLLGLVGGDARLAVGDLDELLGWLDWTENFVDRLRP